MNEDKTRFNFTLKALTALSFPKDHKLQKFRVYDAKVRGLTLRIMNTGEKSYTYMRRLPDNNESARKLIEITLGKFSDLSLEKARIKAEELSTTIGEGKDPTATATAKKFREEKPPEMTYDAVFQTYLNDYAKHETRTWQESAAVHRRHFESWKNIPVSRIDSEEIQDWMNTLAGEDRTKKHVANRSLDQMKAVINYGIRKKLCTAPNPCNGVDRFKVKSRQRFIQPGDEFARFAQSLAEEPNQTWQDFFWLALFVAARRSNVLSMQWDQISFELETWTIPITKNGDSQTVPLTPSAMSILERRFNAADRHEVYVFPSDRKGRKTGVLSHMTNPKEAWSRVLKRACIEDLRIHDLRRTAGSYMAILNHSTTVIGQALGHRSAASTAVYSRLTKDPVRQAMIQAQTALFNPEILKSTRPSQNQPANLPLSDDPHPDQVQNAIKRFVSDQL